MLPQRSSLKATHQSGAHAQNGSMAKNEAKLKCCHIGLWLGLRFNK